MQINRELDSFGSALAQADNIQFEVTADATIGTPIGQFTFNTVPVMVQTEVNKVTRNDQNEAVAAGSALNTFKKLVLAEEDSLEFFGQDTVKKGTIISASCVMNMVASKKDASKSYPQNRFSGWKIISQPAT